MSSGLEPLAGGGFFRDRDAEVLEPLLLGGEPRFKGGLDGCGAVFDGIAINVSVDEIDAGEQCDRQSSGRHFLAFWSHAGYC